MVQRFFLLLPFILILPDVYIYRMFIDRLVDNTLLKILYWVPSALLLIGLVYFVYIANEEVSHGRWAGWFSVVFMLFTVPKVIFMFCSLLGLFFHHFWDWPRPPFDYTALGLSIAIAGCILYGTFIGRNKFTIRNVTYASPYLPPAFDGYRIALIADMHIGTWEGNTKPVARMVRMINQQQPDLITFAGDLVNHRAVELTGFEGILSQLHAPDGVYSVLGNHDFGPYYQWETKQDQANNVIDLQERQKQMGWHLLNNDNVILHRGNDSIALLGVENDGEPPFSQYADLPKAISGTEGMFQILISHNPTHWRREVLPDSHIDLMVAGHTHAMQFQLGGFSPSSRYYKEWSGMYYEGERGLYVNIGVGSVGLPFRFGAWPEITIITLRREETGQ